VTTRIKRKLIEVALPLEAINVASAREKSIRRLGRGRSTDARHAVPGGLRCR
jgi:hypothetical protein